MMHKSSICVDLGREVHPNEHDSCIKAAGDALATQIAMPRLANSPWMACLMARTTAGAVVSSVSLLSQLESDGDVAADLPWTTLRGEFDVWYQFAKPRNRRTTICRFCPWSATFWRISFYSMLCASFDGVSKQVCAQWRLICAGQERACKDVCARTYLRDDKCPSTDVVCHVWEHETGVDVVRWYCSAAHGYMLPATYLWSSGVLRYDVRGCID
ncbi:hypothetical protein GN958_ATG00086 [Phytophthora infestans]|uniref:Uncharacterized protein n=1 Tax=Phytophthora infestans TaxID=4787 RepID=A0A8S9VCZ6_PHYIN|nr:hypothetical protein GN958_ATG00086 [Phytophthora infestans]